jgi:acyl-coenzyme A thioesterase PaaI-like protein
MEQRTHEKIAAHLCGTPIALSEGKARVALEVSPEMAADGRGLAHGGFTFGLADYAAMLAVNEPTVVLAGATLKFLGPVVVGDRVEAEAAVDRQEGKKRWVKVTVRRAGQAVLEGELFAVVPDRHILDTGGRS